jgi:anaphase-promoting complex subunit 8
MTYMFHIYTNQELGQTTDQVHAVLDQVLGVFPKSAFLKAQRAQLLYHSKDFEESAAIFASLLHFDPYRLDAMDNYSNVLYVLDHRPTLAFLAQLAAHADKFRPETCCIVGNYYSRNSEHEKAVVYFRRALTLDRNFLSAWTLMGHEYVEMKNTHAALESYRRGVDVNRKDYRAWHGLGLTYEMLEMHSYALYYHQRAAALRPFDGKTWQAVGACFARIGKLGNAIRAYKRALVAGSYDEATASGSFASGGDSVSALGGGVLDPESLYQIALLYERMDEIKESAAYMELVLAQEEGAGFNDEDNLNGLVASHGSSTAPGAQQPMGGVGVTPTTCKARMWLARYAFESADYQRANELANELCQDGVEVEEAKALIRDIRSRVESEKATRSRTD